MALFYSDPLGANGLRLFQTKGVQSLVDQMHTVEAVAPRAGMSKQALYAACRAHQFPHVRIGKRIRIPESLLEKWIQEQAAKNTNAQGSKVSLETAP